MMIPVLSDPIPVFVAPVNEITQKWGVYSIPMMCRLPDGRLMIRVNGEQDLPFTGEMQQAPNLYFSSDDDGATWYEDNASSFDDYVFTGIAPPYLRLRNGSIIAVRGKRDLAPIVGVPYRKEFVLPNGEAVVHSYCYGDLPEACRGAELLRFPEGSVLPEISDVVLDFPSREVLVNCAADLNGSFVPETEYLQPYVFKRPYISALTEADDGTLLAVCYGQHPDVDDRYCAAVYCVASVDGGKTWKYRGTVASDPSMPNGYSGDGNEITMALAQNGDLLCVMRMDMSKGEDDGTECGTVLSVSHDGGFTWEQPRRISDASVTPQIVSLKNGVVFVAYGRPGVHFRYSLDCGKTWSEEISIIGKNLREELADGKSYFDAKYGDTSSYSNLYVEKISDSSVLVLYNDAKYDPGDGLKHKAAMVRRIEFTDKK